MCVPVPCAGMEAPYELRIMSGVALELVPLPELQCTVLHGEGHSCNTSF
jgi:hypothetical protein